MCIFVSQTKPLINKSSDTIIFEEIVLIFFLFVYTYIYMIYLIYVTFFFQVYFTWMHTFLIIFRL